MRFRSMILFLITILIVATPLSAQVTGDASVWVKMSEGNGPTVIPWLTLDTGSIFIEMRSNFDWPETTTFLLGKSFSVGSSTLVPELGMIWNDEFRSVTPQLLAWGGQKTAWFCMNQASLGINDESPDFFYHWTEVNYEVISWLRIGAAEQIYWEWDTPGAKAELDIGPEIKFSLGKTYLKIWGTTNPDTNVEKLFVGLGHAF